VLLPCLSNRSTPSYDETPIYIIFWFNANNRLRVFSRKNFSNASLFLFQHLHAPYNSNDTLLAYTACFDVCRMIRKYKPVFFSLLCFCVMITHFWHLSFYVLYKGLKPFAEVDEFNGLLIFVLINKHFLYLTGYFWHY
jgi:hypothetical protein